MIVINSIKCKQKENYQENIIMKSEIVNLSSSMYFPAFGLEIVPKNSIATEDLSRRVRNQEKKIGYWPVGGFIIGFLRIHFALTAPNLSNRVKHGVRGMIECTNLGFLILLPTDLIVRELDKQKLKSL